MRIHIAGGGDTLETIARRYQTGVQQLLWANPRLARPETTLEGSPVVIPDVPVAGPGMPSFCPPAVPLEPLDTWIPLTPLSEMAETEYDALVIGTGIGGGAALWRLCEQWRNTGKRIAVVEAGKLLLPSHAWNVPTLDSLRNARLFRTASTPVGEELPEFSGARELYALGGRTLFWGTVTPRMSARALASWPVSIQEMEIYYNIAESVMNVSRGYGEDSSFTSKILHRLWNQGFPDAEINPMAVDVNPTKYGHIRGDAAFSSLSFLSIALNLKPFDLAVEAPATKIVVRDGKVIGAEVKNASKGSTMVKAKTVVVAASALDAPRLLLHSGIPGPAIGHYLTDHTFLLANGIIRTDDYPEVLGVLTVLIPSSADRPYQIQLQGPDKYYYYQHEEKIVRDEWGLNFFGAFGIVEPRFENFVYLKQDQADRYGVPKIGVQFSYSAKDLENVRQMSIALENAASAAGVQFLGVPGQPDICFMPPGADYHESCTCRMGEDPSTSATDRFGQIHGITGLYVAGNSVLPSLGAANPTLTSAALAIRTADYIAETT